MGKSTHAGTRVLLSVLLVFSLLGISGLGVASKAFAEDEPIASEASVQSPPDMECDIAEDAVSQSEPADAAALDDEEDAPEAQSAAGGEADPDQPKALSLTTPERRYVYESVYGVLANEYTVASNKSSGQGALLSATRGETFGSGVSIDPGYADLVVSEKLAYVPFERDGKCGLLDVRSKTEAIGPIFDIAGSTDRYSLDVDSNSKVGNYWGFIQLGEVNGSGTCPNAKAVLTVGGRQVLELQLEGYLLDTPGYVSSSVHDGKATFSVTWYKLGDDGKKTHSYIAYSEGANGFQPTENASGSITYATPDGRKVTFREVDGKVAFSVADAAGSKSEYKAIDTDNVNSYSFGVVSNLIEVKTSNGYDYQYFTLDGSLVQNLNGKKLTGLGGYASYSRTDFETQKTTQVFLDTSDDCKEAVRIPAIQTKFSNGDDIVSTSNNTVFECLTEGNKIQRYDSGLNLLREFDATLDLVGEKQQGRYPYWSIKDLRNDSWLFSEGVKSSSSWGASVIDKASNVFKGASTVPLASLGLSSEYVPECEMANGVIFMMDDSGSNVVHLLSSDLAPLKTIDLSSFIPTGKSLVSIDVREGHPGSVQSKLGALTLQLNLYEYKDGSSYNTSETLYLDKNCNPTGFSGFKAINDDTYCALKDGKWGFIDANFQPLSGFVFDDIYGYDVGRLIVVQDGKKRLLDRGLNDVLGISFDSLSPLGAGCIQVKSDGSYAVFDSSLQQVNLYGFLPFEKDEAHVTRHTNGARVLPTGDLVIYLRNSQGKTGAINLDGDIVIPFEYEDYAEEIVTSNPTSDYIMLKDQGGWFFMPVADLQPAGPNDDCETLGHDYAETKYEPTCTTNGYTQYVCSRCGHAYRDDAVSVPALGHDFKQTQAGTAPTCTEAGKGAVYACARCGAEKQDADTPSYGGHLGYDWTRIVEPSCTEPGLMERTCSRCGNHEESETAPYGHSWSYPTWSWSDDFQAATASMTCTHGCGGSQDVAGEVSHADVEDGVRHSAQFEMNGRRYQDGRLSLGWVDDGGIPRTLVVKGESVVDGFYVWPKELELPGGQDAFVEISVDTVSEGGVFDALVSKIGSGWPAGTFDVRLSVDGEEMHEGFGALSFAFPAGVESSGKQAIVYHCHKNDRDNISAHEAYVAEDGRVTLRGITDLSTFAVALLEEGVMPVGPAGPTKSPTPTLNPVGSSLAQAGDRTSSAEISLGVVAILGIALAAVACRRNRMAK